MLLQTYQSSVGFASGVAATVAGGLSALFTNATTARALGGGAGIASGVGAEFQSNYFKDQLVGMLQSGINLERLAIHSEIAANQAKASYTLESALKDAIRYNAACSVSVAFDRLRDNISNRQNVGLEEAKNTVNKVNLMAAELDLRDTRKKAEAKQTLKYQQLRNDADDAKKRVAAAQDAYDLAAKKTTTAQFRLAGLKQQLDAAPNGASLQDRVKAAIGDVDTALTNQTAKEEALDKANADRDAAVKALAE